MKRKISQYILSNIGFQDMRMRPQKYLCFQVAQRNQRFLDISFTALSFLGRQQGHSAAAWDTKQAGVKRNKL